MCMIIVIILSFKREHYFTVKHTVMKPLVQCCPGKLGWDEEAKKILLHAEHRHHPYDSCFHDHKSNYPRFESSGQFCWHAYVTINDEQSIGNTVCQYASLLILERLFGVEVAVSRETHVLMSKIFSNPPIQETNNVCNTTEKNVKFRDLFALFDNLAKRADFLDTRQKYPLYESIVIEGDFCPYELILRNRDYLSVKLFLYNQEFEQLRNKLIRHINPKKYVDLMEDLLVVQAIHNDSYMDGYPSNTKGLRLQPDLYYKNAFDLIQYESNSSILVLCNNIFWCDRYIKHPSVFFYHLDTEENIYNIYLVLIGDIHVVSFNTLGFMGAALSNKVMYYPYLGLGSDIEAGFDCVSDEDVIEVDGVKLNNFV